jgi:hypothetical protein
MIRFWWDEGELVSFQAVSAGRGFWLRINAKERSSEEDNVKSNHGFHGWARMGTDENFI